MSHFHILCITKCCLWPFLAESVLYHSRVHEFGAVQSPGCWLRRASAQASPPLRQAQPMGWLRSQQPGIGAVGIPARREQCCCQLLSSRSPAPLAGPRHTSLFPKYFGPSSGDPWRNPHRVWSLKEGPSSCLCQLNGGHWQAAILVFILS